MKRATEAESGHGTTTESYEMEAERVFRSFSWLLRSLEGRLKKAGVEVEFVHVQFQPFPVHDVIGMPSYLRYDILLDGKEI